jgi:D-ribose pyranose/furanose isomerase RbsD
MIRFLFGLWDSHEEIKNREANKMIAALSRKRAWEDAGLPVPEELKRTIERLETTNDTSFFDILAALIVLAGVAFAITYFLGEYV